MTSAFFTWQIYVDEDSPEPETQDFYAALGNNVTIPNNSASIEQDSNSITRIHFLENTKIDGASATDVLFLCNKGSLEIITPTPNYTSGDYTSFENFTKGVANVTGGTFTCSNASFIKNSSVSPVTVSSGIASFTDCLLQENSSANGGAVYVTGSKDASATFTNCQLLGNYATSGKGGALFIDNVNAEVTLNSCSVKRNYIVSTFPNNPPLITHLYGGGVYFSKGILNLKSSTVTENFRIKDGATPLYGINDIIQTTGAINKTFNDIYIYETANKPTVNFSGSNSEYGNIICGFASSYQPVLNIDSSFEWKTNYSYGASLITFYTNTSSSTWTPENQTIFNFMDNYTDKTGSTVSYDKEFQFLDIGSWGLLNSDNEEETDLMQFTIVVNVDYENKKISSSTKNN